jgi:hypothetical protein
LRWSINVGIGQIATDFLEQDVALIAVSILVILDAEQHYRMLQARFPRVR